MTRELRSHATYKQPVKLSRKLSNRPTDLELCCKRLKSIAMFCIQ